MDPEESDSDDTCGEEETQTISLDEESDDDSEGDALRYARRGKATQPTLLTYLISPLLICP